MSLILKDADVFTVVPKEVSLWVRVQGGRIIYSAGQKEWLRTPSEYPSPIPTYDVELKGNYEERTFVGKVDSVEIKRNEV